MLRFASITLLLTALAWAATASAKGTEADARDAFTQGVSAFEQGQLVEALDLFHQAYALKPSYRILYNIAQTEAELGRPHKALATFEAYLAEGGTDVPKKRRKTVEAQIRRLSGLVGTINVNGPQGSDLWMDGEHIGALPLAAPIRARAGTHRISVQLPGLDPCEREVEVPARGSATELCEPTPPALPQPDPLQASVTVTPPVTRPIDASPKSSLLLDKIAPWTATGLGAVCLTVGTILGIKAAGLNGELQDACPDSVCPTTRRNDVESLPKLAAGADVLFVATAVLAATATVLFIAPWKKKHRAKDQGAAP